LQKIDTPWFVHLFNISHNCKAVWMFAAGRYDLNGAKHADVFSDADGSSSRLSRHCWVLHSGLCCFRHCWSHWPCEHFILKCGISRKIYATSYDHNFCNYVLLWFSQYFHRITEKLNANIKQDAAWLSSYHMS